MKLLDDKTLQERMDFRKRSLKYAIFCGTILLLSLAAISWSFEVARPLGGYLFFGGLLVAFFSGHGVGAAIFSAVMPPISKAFAGVILVIFLGGGLIYVAFFDDGGVTQ